jgi:hypothetical protein
LLTTATTVSVPRVVPKSDHAIDDGIPIDQGAAAMVDVPSGARRSARHSLVEDVAVDF